jgi:hypothetical protein
MRGLKRIQRAVLYVLALLCCSPLTALAQVTFSTQAYPIKQAPYQVTTGDFNGDGKPDVAVLSLAGGTVSILLNNGDGTFASAVDFPAITPQVFIGLSFRGIAVGDINGDNKLDLIATNPGASVNVLLGRGDGTFQPPISTLASAGEFIGSLGDFNPGFQFEPHQRTFRRAPSSSLCGFECGEDALEVHTPWVRNKISPFSSYSMLPWWKGSTPKKLAAPREEFETSDP